MNSGESPMHETNHLRVGLVGAGMIVDETYRPAFLQLSKRPIYSHAFGEVRVDLVGIASRTGSRAKALKERHPHEFGGVNVVVEPDSVKKLIELGVDVVCIATPDDRHYSAALEAINAGKHVLIEKPSVLTIQEWKTLVDAAEKKGVLAKVVYHKLLDPDHKKLRTLVADGVLKHVNNGYCSLLEPKSISKGQFAQWIDGRNPATYVAVHYIKLIDFTFGGRLWRVSATGQRGIVGSKIGDTWDSVQLRLEYEYDDGREAAFDIHTSWVTPDNFPGYVEQEVQFRFDNGVWNGHSRKRGVELTVEGETPISRKTTLNNHYNGEFLEPWGERTQRGYGIEVLTRFFEEVSEVEFTIPPKHRDKRLAQIRRLAYNDLSADKQVVAAVQSLEAILKHHAVSKPGGLVNVIGDCERAELWLPGSLAAEELF
jgi:D-galacturonate reductase